MADIDLIARLYPFDDETRWAKRVVEVLNPSRYVGKPPQPSPGLRHSRYVRHPTEPPEDQNGLDCPHLELRFSRRPRTNVGFVFGKDPDTSDIVLVDEKGISEHHCTITFENDFKCDSRYRLVIRDLKSSYGTSVAYNNEAGRDKGGVRRDFRWIISGHDTPNEKRTIVLELHKNLKFQIVVSRHDITSQLYTDNVDWFRQGATSMDDLFRRLGLPSRLPTEPASGVRTPGTGAILLRKTLGEGAFGVVTHIWNVSNADEYALKEPSRKAIREGTVDINAWKKEARIMGRISHDHIVRFFGEEFTSLPRLSFEYVPGGALGDYKYLPPDEGVQVLCQCLSALAYLHEQKPPIVHRDIKPDNILVQYRYVGDIYVKFGDFGLSRESCDPTTICGSPQYVAPEVYNEWDRRIAHGKKRSYTPAVDIWSLGVTVFKCAYDFPPSNATRISWCEEIIRKLKEDLESNPDDLKRFLCSNMVIKEPEQRRSARYCHAQALLLADLGQDRCQTPTQASYAQNYQQSASQYRVTDEYGEDQQTILLQDAQAAAAPWPNPSLDDDSIDSDEIRRYVISDGPPPASQVLASTSSHMSFHESGLQDPLHPLGGGSTVVALGQEISDSSSRITPAAEAPHIPSFPDRSPSSGGRYPKRGGYNSFAARSSSHQHVEHPEPDAVYYHKNEHNKDYGLVLQQLSGEPSWAEPRQSNLQVLDAGDQGYDNGSEFGGRDGPNHAQG